MSLINDALKQAKQAQPQNPPPIAPPLSPVESKRPGSSRWLVTGMIVLALAAVAIFAGLSLSKPVRLSASAESATHSLAVAAKTLKPVPTGAVTPTMASNVASDASPVAVVPPKPQVPKLQGILFAAIRPCAIMNGRTVFLGDRINEFQVAAISKDAVTLQSETETNVLSLSPR